MAAGTEILREYLVSLGFRVNRQQVTTFTNTTKQVDKQVAGLGLRVAGVGAAVIGMVQVFANQMEKLHYSSRRAESTAGNIAALDFAFRNIGLDGDTARKTIEGLARALRLNPGVQGLLESLGVPVTGRDKADVLTDLVGQLRKMPFYLAAQYAGVFGIDPDTLKMLFDGYDKLKQTADLRKEMAASAGVDMEAAAAAAAEYNNTLRQVWEQLGLLKDRVAIELLPAFQSLARVTADFLLEMTKTLPEITKDWQRLNKEWVSGQDFFTKLIEGLTGKALGGTRVVLTPEARARADGMRGNEIDERAQGIHNDPFAAYPGQPLKGNKDAPRTRGVAEDAASTMRGWGRDLKSWWYGDRKPTATAPAKPAAPAEPTAQPDASSQLPLGLRNNNPGNLRSWGDTPTRGGFAVFQSAQQGLSAMAGNLLAYQRRGLDTIREVISTWAPASENDTAAYIAAMVKRLGVGADDMLDMRNPETLRALMDGITRHENRGMQPFSAAQMDAAIQERLGGGRTAPPVTIQQETNITVNGATDVTRTAQAISTEQRSVNEQLADATRNTQGVIE